MALSSFSLPFSGADFSGAPFPLRSPKRYGLLGKNIGYSLSPSLYRPWFDGCAVPATFDLIDVATLDWPMLWDVLQQFDGFCITTPYKQSMLTLLKQHQNHVPWPVDFAPLCDQVGAVNCVVKQKNEGRSDAPFSVLVTNTDALAFSACVADWLSSLAPFPSRLHFVILGAGGAALSSLYGVFSAFSQKGGDFLCTVVTRSKMEEDHVLFKKFPHVRACQWLAEEDHIQGLSFDLDEKIVVINATPMGTFREKTSALLDGVQKSLLPYGDMLVFLVDWAYDPKGETAMALWAKEKAVPFCDGKTLLVSQARFAFQLWCGFFPPL